MIGKLLYPEKVERPRTREECAVGIRPCPYVGCRHHLYLEVLRSGSLKINFPDVEPWDLAWSCSLDIADAASLDDGLTLETVGRLLNLTRERARQIEEEALEKLSDEIEGDS